jgi:hypothetical protein
MATTTNYGWTTPDDTALVKDGAAAIRTLGSSVDTTTKALNPSTTLGDIEYRSSTANTNTRLGIGTTGQSLIVSGGVPAWGTPASGGLTLISETVASANSSISFSSLGSYKQLLLVYSGIRHSGTGSSFTLRLNNSSDAARYQGHSTKTNTTTLTSQGFSATSILFSGDSNDVSLFGINANEGSGLGVDACGSFLLDNYTSTTKNKSFNGTVGYYNNAGAYHSSAFYDGAYMDTAAITSIDIVRLTGSATITNSSSTTIRLYGVS